MPWKKIMLALVILCLTVVVLQTFVVKEYALFDIVRWAYPQRNVSQSNFNSFTKQTQKETSNHQLNQNATDSKQDHYLSDLPECGSTLDKRKEWMKLLLRKKHNPVFPKVGAVNCTKIWENDEQELSSARKYQQSHGRQPARGVRHYLQETANCTSYLLNGGFLFPSVDENELSFPLAFSLVAYISVEQVERLLRAVYRPHNVYCIHPDNKSSDAFHSSLRFIAGCLPQRA